MRKLALIAVLILAGCAADSASQVGGDYPKMDQAGNIYPEQCKGPIIAGKDDTYSLNGKKVWVYFVPPEKFPSKTYLGTNSGNGLVYVNETIVGWRRDDVIRHELCHSIAGLWHRSSEIISR